MRAHRKSPVVNVFPVGKEISLENIQNWCEGFGDTFVDHFKVTEEAVNINVRSAMDNRITATNPVLQDGYIIRDEKGFYSQVNQEEWQDQYTEMAEEEEAAETNKEGL